MATGMACPAQWNNTQLWLDGVVGHGFASMWMAECEFSRQELLSEGEHWVSHSVLPSVDVSPTAHWSFMAGALFSRTRQDDDRDTWEWRGRLGIKYTFTPFKRVRTRLNLRQEYRRQGIAGEAFDERSQRTRLRAEVLVPLDADSYDMDTLWYALLDAEAFIVLDRDLNERFANRTRWRLGVGRKLSYNWRAEAIFMLQTNRESISGIEPTYDPIARLRLKYYFTPQSRRRAMGMGENQ
ncbi:MAG: DUF2490 domain-containing protein [Flavobacteriales bacterium]